MSTENVTMRTPSSSHRRADSGVSANTLVATPWARALATTLRTAS